MTVKEHALQYESSTCCYIHIDTITLISLSSHATQSYMYTVHYHLTQSLHCYNHSLQFSFTDKYTVHLLLLLWL